MTTPLKTWMRSLVPSMTLTCTLTVSPGLKSGMSSRSDAWSTKSSVFIGDTSLLFAVRGQRRASQCVTRRRADGFGRIWCISRRTGLPSPRARQLVNCARCSAHAVKSRAEPAETTRPPLRATTTRAHRLGYRYGRAVELQPVPAFSGALEETHATAAVEADRGLRGRARRRPAAMPGSTAHSRAPAEPPLIVSRRKAAWPRYLRPRRHAPVASFAGLDARTKQATADAAARGRRYHRPSCWTASRAKGCPTATTGPSRSPRWSSCSSPTTCCCRARARPLSPDDRSRSQSMLRSSDDSAAEVFWNARRQRDHHPGRRPLRAERHRADRTTADGSTPSARPPTWCATTT